MSLPSGDLLLLGEVLSSRRRELGRPQREVADRAGMHPTYLSGLENGRRNPTWKMLRALAEALDLELSDLVREVERRASRGSTSA